MTNQQLLENIGRYIESVRLQQNITQAQLAQQSGIGLSTVARCEKGQGCSLDNLINILRALGRLEDLSSLITPPSISPANLLKGQKQHRPKQRARNKQHPSSTPGWSWGDEK